MKVLVLAGGRSAERDVSLASGASVSQALVEAGCEVLMFDPGVSERAISYTSGDFDMQIGTKPPAAAAVSGTSDRSVTMITSADLAPAGLHDVDVVFIALHGGVGEDGHLQALLDAAGVTYTGSGMLASALAMDKNTAKRIFVAEGIPTPNWETMVRGEEMSFAEASESLGLPLVVKPNAQGSTVGLTIVKDKSRWEPALAEAFRWDDRLVFEEYIPGRELTVSVLGDEALPIVEIIPSHGIYDYECKYTSGKTEYVCPADLPAGRTAVIREQGLAAAQALGCTGFARADFRLAEDGHLFCLEVNTIPGMTKTSLLPQAARAHGIEFPELVRRICELAVSGRSAEASQATEQAVR